MNKTELKKCMVCNNIFAYDIGICICKNCDNIIIDKVKKYLDEFPGSNLEDISAYTGIKKSILNEYYKMGILENFKDNNNYCVKCGERINEWERYCSNCYKKICTIRALGNLYNPKENDNITDSSVRFLNSDIVKRRI